MDENNKKSLEYEKKNYETYLSHPNANFWHKKPKMNDFTGEVNPDDENNELLVLFFNQTGLTQTKKLKVIA